MSLKLPAVNPASLTPRNACGYPEPFRSRVMPREKRALGDACGLTKIGINLTTLAPGKESSMRHWHTLEDELIFVLEGEVVLRTDAGEQLLQAGACAGFPAGSTDGHQVDQPERAPRPLSGDQQPRPGGRGHLSGRGPAVERAPQPGRVLPQRRHALLKRQGTGTARVGPAVVPASGAGVLLGPK